MRQAEDLSRFYPISAQSAGSAITDSTNLTPTRWARRRRVFILVCHSLPLSGSPGVAICAASDSDMTGARRRTIWRCRRAGGWSFVLALLQALRFSLLAAILAAAAASPAWAQGKLDAHYTVTLAGIKIGEGSWVIDINDTHYMAAASGITTGLLRAF